VTDSTDPKERQLREELAIARRRILELERELAIFRASDHREPVHMVPHIEERLRWGTPK